MGHEEDTLPSREYTLQLLRKYNVPPTVRRHSINVARRALKIANKIRKAKVDKNLIVIGALLHDVGRSKSHGFDHAIIGSKMLKERGYPKSLSRICETHILGGLDEDDAKEVGLPVNNYIPSTLEEKIICLADKQCLGTKIVSVEERFASWFNKYGQSAILLKSKKRIEEIQKEIDNLI